MADQLVSWLELVTPGLKAPESLRERFTRKVKGETTEFLVDFKSIVRVKNLSSSSLSSNVMVQCEVKISADKWPLFSCSYLPEDFDESKRVYFTATNPTKASMSCLKSLGHKRKWSGYDFFGLNRPDVMAAVTAALQEKGMDEIELIPETPSDQAPLLPNVRKSGATVSWGGCRSYGVPVLESPYQRIVSAEKSYRLQPGYIGIRIVQELCRERVVLCEVTRGADGPLFSCSLAGSLDEPATFRTPTQAMHNIFEVLELPELRRRHWSGHEFFGFLKPRVLASLTCPSHHYKDTAELRLDRYPDLSKLANIQMRKGGPTSSLSGKRAKQRRNEAIHEVVQRSAFGDVVSKFF